MTSGWRGRLLLLTVMVVLTVSACAAGENSGVAHDARNAGFWLGLWHGLITPVTFVISLFTDSVNVYEVRNNGNWYDFGYVLGLMLGIGGSARSGGTARCSPAAVRRRRR